MNTILKFETLIPVGLVVLQSIIILIISLQILNKLKLIRTPYAGMEYSLLIFSASLLFGIFYISTSNTTAIFQSFKTFQNSHEKVFYNTFLKFSQFFLVIFFFEILYGLLVLFITRLMLGFRKPLKEFEEGNIPAAILTAVIVIVFGLILQVACREIIELITPKYITFT